ncbi:MAG: hypothetical protein IKY52_08620 [Clostridia bacterium]|nr:hypothetical protein [Clostridia bacterium]
MLLKFYMIQYGFGMFSNRMTGTAKPADDDNSASSSSSSSSSGGTSEKNTVKEYSLTGYELCRKINYAYQAELEYIFSGHLSSASNLNHVRNYILTFRAVMNYAATYSIDKINRPISDLAKAAAHINPLLGIAVSAALRTAVTAVETVADWQLLTQRKSVVVVKNELSDMSVDLSEIASVLGGDVGKSTEERSGVELTYEQYLTILLLLMTSTENVAMRIGDLIAINVSNVQSGLSEDAIMTDMSFNMKEAYTAVEAKCSVHLDFVIIPEHMAAMFMDEGTKGTWERNSKNTYSFTIIRAY